MCGISGVVCRDTENHLDIARQMQAAMLHRGPDGGGDFHDAHISLAMRRLSVIDITNGWQPLYNEDRSLVLVANGEIYNFVELRQRLEGLGHRFRTNSDCETILHLYEEYGTNCVQYLRGMFAFALWDSRQRHLLIARDRMGEKPLYLYERDGQLIFASEMKALLNSGCVPFTLDPEAINLYFFYSYIPEPMTPLKGVRKLPAGHILTVAVDTWCVTQAKYWDIEDIPPLDGDPIALIRAELEVISEIIVRSDVPVGVALSSGLDSSAIAALAVQKYPGTIQAFSVGYPGRPPNDERAEAKALADYLHIPFHEVELSTEEMVDFFPKLNYWRDDPIADISGYGYYAVMRAARERDVPVVMQGQGGDELFWGYPWVKQAVQASMQKLEHLRTKPLFGTTTCSESMVFYDLAPDFQIAQRVMEQIYTQAFNEAIASTSPYNLFTFPMPWSDVERCIMRLICKTYLLENGIAQGDRLSMASSIELRLPLVDYRLVETVVGLRRLHSDINLPPKAWLKEALKGILPEWVLNRPKRGFAPPTLQWYRSLFTSYGSQLKDGFLVQAEILKPDSARELAQGLVPRGAVAPPSFKALVLETWCRQMVDRSESTSLSPCSLATYGSLGQDTWQLKTPVCLIVFNRPDTTERVFETIRQAKPPKLFIVADGPRENKLGEADKCAAVRAIVERVDWECEVFRNYSGVNLGCRKRVSSGLDWVFSVVEEAIILEDDCVPHSTFFRFCEELLAKYRDKYEIAVISGNNFQDDVVSSQDCSYYFSIYPHCWGWATWRRAWQLYDDSMSSWAKLRNTNWLEQILPDRDSIRYWSDLFQKVYEGFPSWATARVFACWVHRCLTILPNVNLVSNVGFDSTATNTHSYSDPCANLQSKPMSFPLIHPPSILRHLDADTFTEKKLYSGRLQSSVDVFSTHLAIDRALQKLNALENTQALSILKAVPLGRYSLVMYYVEAIALARLGWIEKSIQVLESLISLSPNHKEGKALLYALLTHNQATSAELFLKDPSRSQRDSSECVNGGHNLNEVFPNVTFGSSVQLVGMRNILIGDGCCIADDAWINVCSRDEKVRIRIGKCVLVGRRSTISTAGYLEISDHCILAPNVYLSNADHDYVRNIDLPIMALGVVEGLVTIIEENCWIGTNSTIIGNLTIGRGSVIGANSVILDDVLPFSVVVGNPARTVKMYDPVTQSWERIKKSDDFNKVVEHRLAKELPSRCDYAIRLARSGLHRLDPIVTGGGQHVF